MMKTLPNGVSEPEGAGTSPLNSVSDSNICATEKTLFHLSNQYFCLCPCLRAFLYLFPFISVHLLLSLSSILCPMPGPFREGPEGPPVTPLLGTMCTMNNRVSISIETDMIVLKATLQALLWSLTQRITS